VQAHGSAARGGGREAGTIVTQTRTVDVNVSAKRTNDKNICQPPATGGAPMVRGNTVSVTLSRPSSCRVSISSSSNFKYTMNVPAYLQAHTEVSTTCIGKRSSTYTTTSGQAAACGERLSELYVQQSLEFGHTLLPPFCQRLSISCSPTSRRQQENLQPT
jgi:hypothetical protein